MSAAFSVVISVSRSCTVVRAEAGAVGRKAASMVRMRAWTVVVRSSIVGGGCSTCLEKQGTVLEQAMMS